MTAATTVETPTPTVVTIRFLVPYIVMLLLYMEVITGRVATGVLEGFTGLYLHWEDCSTRAL